MYTYVEPPSTKPGYFHSQGASCAPSGHPLTHTHIHTISFLSPEALPASGITPMAPRRALSVSLSQLSVSDTSSELSHLQATMFSLLCFCHLLVASVHHINSPSPFLFICSGVVSVWGCYKHHWIICVHRCLFPLVNIWEQGHWVRDGFTL